MQKMIALKNLRFGEEHDPPLNVRKAGRDVGIDELAASIDAHGLGQALNVIEEGGLGYVEDGNRRLRALRLLETRGNLVPTSLVKCEVGEKEGLKPGELGLALNTQRVPMHEADRYEAFRQLQEQGQNASDIAKRFGLDLKRVERILALGTVSPLILEAWRKGEGAWGRNDAYNLVAAFTLAPSVKDQETVFRRLTKSHDLWPRAVHAAFGAGDHEVAMNLSFVGNAAYEKAGGKVTVDLFGDNHAVSDTGLLKKLAAEKLKAKVDELVAAGWSWASVDDDLPPAERHSWHWNWRKVEGGKKASAESKAKSGCVIELKSDGTLDITYGLQKPATAKPAKSAPTKPGQPEAKKGPAVLSHSLEQDLDAMCARATKQALQKDAPANPLAGVLAGVVAQQITPDRMSYMPSAVREKLKAVRDAITPAVMNEALIHCFDVKRYFPSAPKEFVLKAVKEAVGPEQAKKLSSGTKAAAWKFALENVPKTGWLPPELRTAHYSGPGASKPKVAKPKVTAPSKKAA